jgi:hypothetical protein
MVQELRQIVLNKQELISALEGHSRMAPNFLPPGKISNSDRLDSSNIAVTISGAANDPHLAANMVLGDSKLMNPLMRYCQENNVALQRSARKAVVVEEDTVSLRLMVDLDDDFTIGVETVTHSYMAAG